MQGRGLQRAPLDTDVCPPPQPALVGTDRVPIAAPGRGPRLFDFCDGTSLKDGG
jgi:hypothetical protein